MKGKSVSNHPEQAHLKAGSKSLNKMDAIASGVQAHIEDKIGYSRKVINDTVKIARALRIPDAQIETWVIHRLDSYSRDTKRLHEIKSLLHKADKP